MCKISNEASETMESVRKFIICQGLSFWNVWNLLFYFVPLEFMTFNAIANWCRWFEEYSIQFYSPNNWNIVILFYYYIVVYVRILKYSISRIWELLCCIIWLCYYESKKKFYRVTYYLLCYFIYYFSLVKCYQRSRKTPFQLHRYRIVPYHILINCIKFLYAQVFEFTSRRSKRDTNIFNYRSAIAD